MPTSIMNSVIFFIFSHFFHYFKYDTGIILASVQRIIFVLIVISTGTYTYQNEIIFKDSRLKCFTCIHHHLRRVCTWCGIKQMMYCKYIICAYINVLIYKVRNVQNITTNKKQYKIHNRLIQDV